MSSITSSTDGAADTFGNNQQPEQQLEQAHLQQTQLSNQLESQLLKQAKGPSTFRKVMGAVTGIAANIVAPGLGGAIGNMIMGGNGNSDASSLMALSALNAQQNSSSLSALSSVMAQNAAATQKMVESGIEYNQKEMAELAALPKGPDPVAFLALTEKSNHDSEIFQATSAVAKAKHEAAMAAIQNIKD